MKIDNLAAFGHDLLWIYSWATGMTVDDSNLSSSYYVHNFSNSLEEDNPVVTACKGNAALQLSIPTLYKACMSTRGVGPGHENTLR
jgi:hypothetical protein